MVTSGFASILNMSIVGFNDPEMSRDQHWLFPVSGGGRADLYLRSQALPSLIGKTKTATLISKTASGGVWQFSVDRSDAPGFYEVRNIRTAGASPVGTGYTIQLDTRGIDTTGTDVYLPDLETALEAVYSRFQTAVIRFLDTDTDVTALTEYSSTASYDVTLAAMPLVEEVQKFLGQRSIRAPGGDVLVKAAIPCFTSIAVVLARSRADATVTTATVQNAVASYVNTTGFSGNLYASGIAGAVDAVLPANMNTDSIMMTGTVRYPDGTEMLIQNAEVLTVPTSYANFVSGRTVVFILDPSDTSVTVSDVDVAEV